MKFIFYAPNIHTGGGKVLWMSLLQCLGPDVVADVFVDERLDLQLPAGSRLRIHSVKPKIVTRFLAEWRLRKLAYSSDTTVFCFGNLPPIFRLKSKVIVFFQNRNLCSGVSLRSFSFFSRMRHYVERKWLKYFKNHAHLFVVQTPSMELLLRRTLSGGVSISVCPFFPTVPSKISLKEDNKLFDFIYVSSGDPHKNHRMLLKAWILLAQEGKFPTLAITLDSKLCLSLLEEFRSAKSEYSIQVTNLECASHDEILRTYSRCSSLIFPSFSESFGLPLLEARQAGLKIIAPELDYVRDVVVPDQTFDPHSERSIARAVKRLQGWEDSPLVVQSPNDFLKQCIQRVRT